MARARAVRLRHVKNGPDPDALAQLALLDLQNNQVAAAEAKGLRALSANRDHPVALTVIGLILHSRARHDDAVRVFNALTLLEPHQAAHWTNLGTALRPTGRYDEALAAHDRALQLEPNSAGVLYNIGLVQMDRLDYASAHGVLKQALMSAPDAAAVRRLFAQCCYDVGLVEDALAALEEWPKLHGLTAEVTAEIAYLLIKMGESRRTGQALNQLSISAREGSQSSLAAVHVLERINHLADARAAMKGLKAKEGTNKSDADILLAEATLAQREDDHQEAFRLLSSALRDQRDFPRRHNLLFPLAKSLDALRRFDEAYAALEEAHRSQIAFLTAITGKTLADESPTMSLVQNGCDPKDIASWNESMTPEAEDSPIFIVGFPRSGTTLLEQTLDAHPRLKSMDEQPFLKKANDEMMDSGIRYPAELGKLDTAQLQSIRARYWERVRKKITLRPEQRLVDKNPLNMLRLPLIRRIFPNARIILAIRHPCDTLLSCFMQQFRAPDLAFLCRDLLTLARTYRLAFDYWYAQLPLLQPISRELRYESFVTDFESQVRGLSDFLQLPWDDAMLAPGEHARAKGFISTPSYAQVIQQVNNRSVGQWKSYAGHFEGILPILMPCIERWNYGT